MSEIFPLLHSLFKVTLSDGENVIEILYACLPCCIFICHIDCLIGWMSVFGVHVLHDFAYLFR
jgi:hypothetical protein